jgi:hypothetical protein
MENRFSTKDAKATQWEKGAKTIGYPCFKRKIPGSFT